jgi:hypothetical protein
MGYTSEPAQRDLILAAVARMTWTADVDAVPYLKGGAHRGSSNAARPQAAAVLRVGVAQLNGRQLLMGLNTTTNAYPLDLESAPSTSRRYRLPWPTAAPCMSTDMAGAAPRTSRPPAAPPTAAGAGSARRPA